MPPIDRAGKKAFSRAVPLDKADLAIMPEASGVSARVVGSASDVESELPFSDPINN